MQLLLIIVTIYRWGNKWSEGKPWYKNHDTDVKIWLDSRMILLFKQKMKRSSRYLESYRRNVRVQDEDR